MTKPKSVLISDIHYNITTLPVADAALRQAVAKANELGVPLIIAGDLHDTKANLRGECISAMLETLRLVEHLVYILRGNHDSINERSTEHSLEFLTHLCVVVDVPMRAVDLDLYLVPYEHDAEALRTYLKTVPPGSTLIMHQGISDSNAGEYIQDKSAINKEDVENFRVISGHYHTRQDIKIGRPRKGAIGLWSYIGNPYTLNFGECTDPDKGFQILMDDGLLEFVPTNLRKHVVYSTALIDNKFSTASMQVVNPDDLVLVKLSGPKTQIQGRIKQEIAEHLNLPGPFRLDLIPDDETMTTPQPKNLPQPDLLDQLIESMNSTPRDQKNRLKALWKGL